MTVDAKSHAFADWRPRSAEGMIVSDRRGMLKASLAGVGGLSLPQVLAAKAQGSTGESGKLRSVILLWMAGGPSHIDTWDPKPDAPREIRGPFGTIPTVLPGVRFCEHYPKQAAMLDRMTIIRSIDCKFSNHQPNQVMQTANLEAEPRLNREGDKYPAIGAVVSKYRPTTKGLPPYVALNVLDKTHIAWGGYLGKQYDPFSGKDASKLLSLPRGLDLATVNDRRRLHGRFDGLRREIDVSGSMEAMDQFGRQAVDLVAGPKARTAFDLSLESDRVRDRFGKHPWCQQALLARRLVESGVPFVTLVLSNHTSSGTWDNHGDNIPPYGGISKGLAPLLPIFDHLWTTLVDDLSERGMLDDVLVLAMGEFGRTPRIGTQASTDGRDHWPVVMSMAMAGGGLRHGRVLGSTERDGGQIKERAVTPGDLAATIYHRIGVPLDASYLDPRGRPRMIIENGRPIEELL